MHVRGKSGLSHSYGVLSFDHYSARSRVVKDSLCPTWDQTLIIDGIRMFGGIAQTILDSPPQAVVEFFDEDVMVNNADVS